MKRASHEAGLSLVEMMISVSISVIVLGALLISSKMIQKSIHGSEVYASTYSDQRRIIDYLGRDLRRGFSISATDPSGAPCSVGIDPIGIDGNVMIVLTLPGYYKSNDSTSPNYDQSLSIVTVGDTVDYGTNTSFAAPVQVTYRRLFLAQEGCTCYVRQEDGHDEVIVRNAEDLSAQVAVSTDGEKATVTAWFHGPYSSARPLVSTFDDLMLRNVAPDFLP